MYAPGIEIHRRDGERDLAHTEGKFHAWCGGFGGESRSSCSCRCGADGTFCGGIGRAWEGGVLEDGVRTGGRYLCGLGQGGNLSGRVDMGQG